jgi:hypothetical protein
MEFYQGIVRSVTPSNKYDIMYDDNDSDEMSGREFAHYSLPPKAQAHAHIARLGGDYCVKERTSCNCAEGHRYHPRSSDTPHFNPSDNKTNIAKEYHIWRRSVVRHLAPAKWLVNITTTGRKFSLCTSSPGHP